MDFQSIIKAFSTFAYIHLLWSHFRFFSSKSRDFPNIIYICAVYEAVVSILVRL